MPSLIAERPFGERKSGYETMKKNKEKHRGHPQIMESLVQLQQSVLTEAESTTDEDSLIQTSPSENGCLPSISMPDTSALPRQTGLVLAPTEPKPLRLLESDKRLSDCCLWQVQE